MMQTMRDVELEAEFDRGFVAALRYIEKMRCWTSKPNPVRPLIFHLLGNQEDRSAVQKDDGTTFLFSWETIKGKKRIVNIRREGVQ